MSGLVARGIARPYLAGALDIAVTPGEVVGLIGPNGSGKTTLLRALAGLSAGDGSIAVGDKALDAMTSSERARRIAYMPAGRHVDWPMRADDIVALSGVDAGRVAETLARVGMSAFAGRRVDTLSTGERARVLLARVLAGHADWLLLDEPTANLDPGHELDVLALLRAEAAGGAGVVPQPDAGRGALRPLCADGGRADRRGWRDGRGADRGEPRCCLRDRARWGGLAAECFLNE